MTQQVQFTKAVGNADKINELLRRYGVKFGIYKNGVFNEQFFPFDPIPRVITAEDFKSMEKGLAQRVNALSEFLFDIYHEKCKSGVFKERQIIKFRFENIIHKNRRWNLLSDSEKADYRALRNEFVRTSAEMLRKFEKSGDKRLESEIERYLSEADSERARREAKLIYVSTFCKYKLRFIPRRQLSRLMYINCPINGNLPNNYSHRNSIIIC